MDLGVDIYLCLPPGRIWHKVFFIMGIWGGEAKAETCALLDSAGHRITWYNVNYASLCQVTLLIKYSLDLKVQCNVNPCLLIFYLVCMPGSLAEDRYPRSKLLCQDLGVMAILTFSWVVVSVWVPSMGQIDMFENYLVFVSLFNGISTFLRLFDAKAILQEEQ